tara:strand:+ start:1082 stop:1513 length:432 start_codon:yes stop_codon:yes gene_type:complete
MEVNKNEILKFFYTNWKGETTERFVQPIGVVFEANKFHPVEQWFLVAYDYDRKAERQFAMNDIICFSTRPQKKKVLISKFDFLTLLFAILFLTLLVAIPTITSNIEKERCKPIHIKEDQWQVPNGCNLPKGFIPEDPKEWKKR